MFQVVGSLCAGVASREALIKECLSLRSELITEKRRIGVLRAKAMGTFVKHGQLGPHNIERLQVHGENIVDSQESSYEREMQDEELARVKAFVLKLTQEENKVKALMGRVNKELVQILDVVHDR